MVRRKTELFIKQPNTLSGSPSLEYCSSDPKDDEDSEIDKDEEIDQGVIDRIGAMNSRWITVLGAEPSDTQTMIEILEKFGRIEVTIVRTNQKLIHFQYELESEARMALGAVRISINGSDQDVRECLILAGKVSNKSHLSQLQTEIHCASPRPKRSNALTRRQAGYIAKKQRRSTAEIDIFNHPGITVRKRYKNMMNAVKETKSADECSP